MDVGQDPTTLDRSGSFELERHADAERSRVASITCVQQPCSRGQLLEFSFDPLEGFPESRRLALVRFVVEIGIPRSR